MNAKQVNELKKRLIALNLQKVTNESYSEFCEIEEKLMKHYAKQGKTRPQVASMIWELCEAADKLVEEK